MPFNKRGVSATPFHGGLEWKQLHRKMILDDTKTSLAKQVSHSDWKNLEKWEGIFQSGNFEQTGKVRENHTKYWKNIREFQKNAMLFFSNI